MVVQHNLTAMNSNRMLGLTSSAQAKSTEKLSSGYKINRAADDAAGLSISEKMRKQIRGLTQASLNAEDGISAVQTAEGALNEVQDMLQRMNELAVKAANGTMSEDDRSYIQNEVDQLVTEIDRVSETTKFNETYLLKGDNTVDPKKAYEYSEIQYTAAKTGELYDENGNAIEEGTLLDADKTYYTSRKGVTASKMDTAVDTDAALLTATKVKFDADVYVKGEDGAISVITAGKEVDVDTKFYQTAIDAAEDVDGTSALSLTVAAGELDDIEVVAGELNAEVSSVSSSIALYKDNADGEAEEIAAGTSIAINDIVNHGKAVEYDVDDEISADDFSKYGNAKQLTDKDGNEVAANGLYSYFDKDGNYEGGLYLADGTEATVTDVKAFVEQVDKETGALTLSLHVGADATANNQISVDIDAMSAKSLGVDGLKVDGKDDYNALRAIETIKASIQMVSEQRSALGAVQNRLEHTIANLDNVVENTTAAESQIRDTDMATEMVKYSNNNILAQAGQSMLAQANQANQGVLSLLG